MSVTPGYAVRFRVHIHGCFAGASSLDEWMEKTVTLPIPPAVGMEVSHGDWNAIISSIYLPLDRGTIEAFVEDDKEIYNAQLRHEPRSRGRVTVMMTAPDTAIRAPTSW